MNVSVSLKSITRMLVILAIVATVPTVYSQTPNEVPARGWRARSSKNFPS